MVKCINAKFKCTYLAVISFSLTEAVAVEDWGEFGIVMK